ncbi:hypothetical protein SUDANB15_00093 [Streptomyces sp. enrichment culture]
MPVGSQTDGGGCRPPHEHVVRVGYPLDADDGCIADARHHAATFLEKARADHSLPVSVRAQGLTQLMVSELVTNARKYAPDPVRMELRVTADSVEVSVRDSDPTTPQAVPVDPGRIGRHGLGIVMAVAQDFEVRCEPADKRITARIALIDDPGGAVTGRRLL